jgi:uncharacterized membrane protein YebE (DUF533 family)
MFDSRKLLDELMGAGAAPQQAMPGRGGGEATKSAAAGGFASIIGQVLGQATAGLKGAAQDVEARTGVGGKADEMLKQATGGRGAGDLLAQARELASQNKLATGAVIGGLASLILGTGTGRGLALNAAKLGGLALIGGLAYKSWQNYQAGKPPIDLRGGVEQAPTESPFGDTANEVQDKATALLIIRAMIAAASADGVVDNVERNAIVGGLENAGLDVHAAKFLDQEFARPASVEALVAGATTPEIATQVYTAARLAADPDQPAEQRFLARLAAGLKLEPELVNHIDAAARSAREQM